MSTAMDQIIPDETRRDPDETRRKVLTENTAQVVLKHLDMLKSNRVSLLTRWIWELLQNARDTSTNADTKLVASVEYKRREEDERGELIFQHNGPKFKEEDIAHLIYHGTTKLEDEAMIGQYGSGFLTTHLLSPVISISGQLEDGRSFQFRLKREVGSVEELRDSMDQAWNDFNNSLSTGLPSDDRTTFQYSIENSAVEVVEKGLATLKKCAPFVVAFNKEFSRINIQSTDGSMSFEVTERLLLPQNGLRQVTVSEKEDEKQQGKVYLLAEAEGEKTSVAVPLEPIDNGQICLPVSDTPRLFLGFPLVGTENFSFPAIINSFEFGPTESRDGVFLGVGNDEVNHENQSIIQEACELHIRLLSFVASSGWRNTFTLAEVPSIREQKWLDKCWLKETLEEQLIEQFRQTPSVVSKAGSAIPASESILPIAEKDEGVEALWDLLNGWRKFRDMLPRRDEAIGWSDAIRSWSTIYGEDNPMSFCEAMDGKKLASHIDKETQRDDNCGRIDDLKVLLHEDVSAICWLDQFHQFLNENSLQEIVRDYHIVLDQEHYLDQLSKLHRDQGISEELKDIAELLEWEVRTELRDVKLSSLADEDGAGDMKNEYVVKKLIEKLQERAEKNTNDNFAKASVGIFSWIVGKKDWDRLRGFPVFAEESNSDNRKVIELKRTEENDDLPLAPVLAWPEDLQPYFELFPWRFVLAKDFFTVASDEGVWQILERQGFLKRDVITTKDLEINFAKFPPDESLGEEKDKEHKTDERVAVTNIAFLNKDEIGIMARVRKSRPLAGKFWRFLTEYMVNRDACGLEKTEADCACGKSHHYFSAAWLMPLIENRWVPLEKGGQNKATAESLGSLLRSIDEGISSLPENEKISKLLKAVGVKHYDLMLETVAVDSGRREDLENTIMDMLVTTGGDLSPVREFIRDMKDENFCDHLEDYRKKRRMGRERQCLGQRVEDLVRKSLEDEGFTVDRTGTGSDFEISAESGDVANLKLSLGDRNWLIEVKSTRNQEVRMTDIQAKTAVKEGDRFLLCVVPVESEDTEPELDAVRNAMRFVQGIGCRVAALCEDIEALESLRKDIRTNGCSGIQLYVESGTARVHVANSVWENDGFRLEDLAERLAQSGDCSQTT